MSVEFSSYQTFLDALAQAQTVNLTAYTLGHGKTEQALIAAAAHGARIRVRLAGTVFDDPHGGLALHNAHECANLRAHGIDAGPTDAPATHMKAAIIDGQAYFDDRNWCNQSDLIIRSDTESDLAATAAILAGQAGASTSDGLALTKGDAIHAEAGLLADPQASIFLETESLGPSVITTLLKAAAPHTQVRVLLTRAIDHASVRIEHEIAALQACGVQICTTETNDKFCIVGEQAWVGSANATGGDPAMSDWGIVLHGSADVMRLRERFAATWARALPEIDTPKGSTYGTTGRSGTVM